MKREMYYTIFYWIGVVVGALLVYNGVSWWTLSILGVVTCIVMYADFEECENYKKLHK